MSKDQREKFYSATGRIANRRESRIHEFCETVEDAMAASGLSRCEALGCLAIIIAREANAEPDPPPAFTVAHNVELVSVNRGTTPEELAGPYAQSSFQPGATEKEAG
jgi:hypothetical protein